MSDIIKCKDCKYLQKLKFPEKVIKKYGQIYECSLDTMPDPTPDDYCSKAKRKEAEQEPCDDVVSREAVRKILAKYTLGESRLAEELNELPPVTQKSEKWIPVSDEDLPKEGESVIASTEYGVYPEARYTKEYGWEWAYEAGADYWKELEGVTAWMPLPKTYKPHESEEESDG